MELSISLPELELLIDSEREKIHNSNKFLAAINGINLDAASASYAEDAVERAKNRARALAAGMDEESYEFSTMGLGIETDEEEE